MKRGHDLPAGFWIVVLVVVAVFALMIDAYLHRAGI